MRRGGIKQKAQIRIFDLIQVRFSEIELGLYEIHSEINCNRMVAKLDPISFEIYIYI